MRLSFALPAAAGALLLGWAGVAAAATATAPPPAAPIFYCPSAAKGAPAGKPQACPTAAPAAPAPAVLHRHVRHHRQMRFAERRTVDWRRADLSEGQKFIHDYERRHQGFEVDAGPPPCPDVRACPPAHREWAEAPPPPPPRVIVERAPPQPPQVIVERAPPPPQQVIIEREAPPPPKIIIEHPPAPPPQVVFERAPAPPPQVIYDRAPPCPERCPPPRAYGWQDREEGGGVMIERRESEREGGWRYSERNGRGHYESWGDARQGRPCPPQVPEGACSGDAGYDREGYAREGYASEAWRDGGGYGEVEPYAGRDAYGYLVWPGKRE